MDEVDFIIFVVILVFIDLMDKCFLVEVCCDVFDCMVKVMFKMVNV